jgi:hypothetical protein
VRCGTTRIFCVLGVRAAPQRLHLRVHRGVGGHAGEGLGVDPPWEHTEVYLATVDVDATQVGGDAEQAE